MSQTNYYYVKYKGIEDKDEYIVWSEGDDDDAKYFYSDGHIIQETDVAPEDWTSYSWNVLPNHSTLVFTACAECDKPSGYDYLCFSCRQVADSINGN